MHCCRLHFVLLLILLPAFAQAQTTTQTFVLGGGGKVSISDDQKLMLSAAQKIMARDFKSAEQLYSQAISINGRNIDAYLQRGVVRHELHNDEGSASDARMVVALANEGLKTNDRNPNLYYDRGMGLRLLRDYNGAFRDVQAGMKLSGNNNWQTDLDAIAFEAKASK